MPESSLDRQIHELLDGALGESAAADLRQRLVADRVARQRLHELAVFDALLQRTAHQGGEPVLHHPAAATWQRWAWPALAAAAAVVIAAVFALPHQDRPIEGIHLLDGVLVERATPATALTPGQLLVAERSATHLALTAQASAVLEADCQLYLPTNDPGRQPELVRGALRLTVASSPIPFRLTTGFAELTTTDAVVECQLVEEEPCRSLSLLVDSGSVHVRSDEEFYELGPGDDLQLYGIVPPRNLAQLDDRFVQSVDPGTKLLVTTASDGSDPRRHGFAAGIYLESDGLVIRPQDLRRGNRVSLRFDEHHLIDRLLVRGHSLRGTVEAVDADRLAIRLDEVSGPQVCTYQLDPAWQALAGETPVSRDRVRPGYHATCDLTTDGHDIIRVTLPATEGRD